MATRTFRIYPVLSKLPAVRIFMAAPAISGCRFEVHVAQRDFHVGRFMALDAGDGAVRANQRKCRCRMIKTNIRGPRFSRVACLAAGKFAIGQHFLHTRFELAMVRIHVTLRAGKRFESIGSWLPAAGWNSCLVTLGAGNRHMAPRQWEARGLMLRQGEGGRHEALSCVAILALALVGSGGELPFVYVFVAILTRRLLYFEHSLDPGRDVALGAGHFGVFALKRVAGGCVLFDSKCGAFESLHSMATGAIAAVLSPGELATVRVLVAIKAVGKFQRSLEVAAVMAINALYRCVLPEQRVLSLGMVKVCRYSGF